MPATTPTTTTTWTYGGLRVSVTRRSGTLRVGWLIAGFLAIVFGPTALAAWSLVHWFPISIPVELSAAALFWIALSVTAKDDDDPT